MRYRNTEYSESWSLKEIKKSTGYIVYSELTNNDEIIKRLIELKVDHDKNPQDLFDFHLLPFASFSFKRLTNPQPIDYQEEFIDIIKLSDKQYCIHKKQESKFFI